MPYGHDDYELLDEYECMTIIDDFYNEGVTYEMMLEDCLQPVSSMYEEGHDALGRCEWVPAQQISDELGQTWGEIELLPVTLREEGGLH